MRIGVRWCSGTHSSDWVALADVPHKPGQLGAEAAKQTRPVLRRADNGDNGETIRSRFPGAVAPLCNSIGGRRAGPLDQPRLQKRRQVEQREVQAKQDYPPTTRSLW